MASHWPVIWLVPTLFSLSLPLTASREQAGPSVAVETHGQQEVPSSFLKGNVTAHKITQCALCPYCASELGKHEVSMASSSEGNGLFS